MLDKKISVPICPFSTEHSSRREIPSTSWGLILARTGITSNSDKKMRSFEQGAMVLHATATNCMVYCLHLWDDSVKYLFDALDSLQR